ncbi:unnamed protein product [marine sediment metagenome]|uniref:Uncharacterized protein n=1 Tax=marine sediment metagenome TaxID=412755 RepID=X0TIT9_9ZZZZ
MSNYHILSADQYGNSYRVVFHVPVPSQVNEIGTNYRTAIVEWQGGAENIQSSVPFIAGAELTQMQAGELYEVSETFNSNPTQTLADKRDALDARFADVVSEVQADFQDRLGYWGYSRDVP